MDPGRHRQRRPCGSRGWRGFGRFRPGPTLRPANPSRPPTGPGVFLRPLSTGPMPAPLPDASHGKTTHVHVHTDVTLGVKRVSHGGGPDPVARLGVALLALALAYERRAALAASGRRALAALRGPASG